MPKTMRRTSCSGILLLSATNTFIYFAIWVCSADKSIGGLRALAFSTYQMTTPLPHPRLRNSVPAIQRTNGPRAARRLNRSFKHLYRHDFNETQYGSDPFTFLKEYGGYSTLQIHQMNATFPPLLSLSVQGQLYPKLQFLRHTLKANTSEVPAYYFGARLERTLAPRHAFLVHYKLPHGKQLFQETSIGRNGTMTRWDEFWVSCRSPKKFAALCQQWRREMGNYDPNDITSDDVHAFDTLFARGILAAARNEMHSSPYHDSHESIATSRINITSAEMLQLLIQHGAAPLECDHHGVTLLHWASGAGHIAAIETLWRLFPNPHRLTTGRDEATLLHWAAAGATGRIFGTGGHTNVCQFLLKQAPDNYVNSCTRDGNTPVMWAAWSGTLETVQLLVRQGANAHATNRRGCTAAHWAASGGNLGVCRFLANEVGVDFTLPNGGGNTPLTHAVAFGRTEVVAWILREVLKKKDDVALTLAQDFVEWDDGDPRRQQVLELFGNG